MSIKLSLYLIVNPTDLYLLLTALVHLAVNHRGVLQFTRGIIWKCDLSQPFYIPKYHKHHCNPYKKTLPNGCHIPGKVFIAEKILKFILTFRGVPRPLSLGGGRR